MSVKTTPEVEAALRAVAEGNGAGFDPQTGESLTPPLDRLRHAIRALDGAGDRIKRVIKRGLQRAAYDLVLDDGQVVAFAPQCTHLGCAYHWDDPKKQFLCPCHTSVFSIDGAVVSGPAPRPLDRFESKVEKNKLLLGEVHESKESAG